MILFNFWEPKTRSKLINSKRKELKWNEYWIEKRINHGKLLN